MKIIIKGRLAGMNEFIDANRKNKFAGATLKRNEQNRVFEAITEQYPTGTLKTPITLLYSFYEPNKKRDKDNISAFAHKVIQDALVDSGLIKNDGWADIDRFADMFFVDAENPRIEVTILENV